MKEIPVNLTQADMQMVMLAMQLATLRLDEKFGNAIAEAKPAPQPLGSPHQAGVPQGPSCGEGETSANVTHPQQET